MMSKKRKVILKFIDLLNIKKRLTQLKLCCKEKDKIIKLLNREIEEYNLKFSK